MDRNLLTGCSLTGAVLLIAFALSADLGQVNSQAQSSATAQQSVNSTDRTCLTCHSGPGIRAVLSTPHGTTALPGAAESITGCATCHGDSSAHSQSMQAPGVVFAEGSALFPASDAAAQNRVCVSCHQAQETSHPSGNADQATDLSCASCHTIHPTGNAFLNPLNESLLLSKAHAQ